MSSLKCDKTLIKQIIFKTNGQSSREGTGSLSHSKLQSQWRATSLLVRYKILQTVSTSKNHTILYHPYLAHTHWLFTRLISSLEVCYSSEQKIKAVKSKMERPETGSAASHYRPWWLSQARARGKSRMQPPTEYLPTQAKREKEHQRAGESKNSVRKSPRRHSLWANSLRPGALTNTTKHPTQGQHQLHLRRQALPFKESGQNRQEARKTFFKSCRANQPIYFTFKNLKSWVRLPVPL